MHLLQQTGKGDNIPHMYASTAHEHKRILIWRLLALYNTQNNENLPLKTFELNQTGKQ